MHDHTDGKMKSNTALWRDPRAGLLMLALAHIALVLRVAWMSDDAYITLRAVDNFINGYGLVWNAAERVQAYTHPLWMLLLSGAYSVTHEAYFTTLTLSLIISMGVVGLIAVLAVRRGEVMPALLGLAILTFSRAYIDYSTSGLENPLTHLLLAGFLIVYLRGQFDDRSLVWLGALAGLAALNRMDTLLFYIPPLLVPLIGQRRLKGLWLIGAGFIPFAAWEVFSIFYYGFPFPNTAYAKLNTGIPSTDLLAQGLMYFRYNLLNDPITLLATLSGIGLSAWRGWRERSYVYPAAALGIALYLIYVARVGGDFMAGRFFSTSLLGAVILMVGAGWPKLPAHAWIGMLASVALIGFEAAAPTPVRFADDHGPTWEEAGLADGIVDERIVYAWCTGLIHAAGKAVYPDCPAVAQAQGWRDSGQRVVENRSNGLPGYVAGPDIYIVDVYALADPLLARIPMCRRYGWRIGHFQRPIPPGYFEVLRGEQTHLNGEIMAAYYDAITRVVRGDLWDRDRLTEIWRLNTGYYDALINQPADLTQTAGLVRLLNWKLPTPVPGAINWFELNWQASSSATPASTRILMLDENGNKVTESIGAFGGVRPDGTATEAHYLTLPDQRPATYTLQIGAYTPSNSWDCRMEITEIAPFKVPPSFQMPDEIYTIDAALGGEIALIGYTLEQNGAVISVDEFQPGQVTLTLYWQAIRQPADQNHIFVHVMSGGAIVAQEDGAPYGGKYSTQVWDAGEIVPTVHSLTIPEGSGSLEIYTGMYQWPDLIRLAVIQDGVGVPDGRIHLK